MQDTPTNEELQKILRRNWNQYQTCLSEYYQAPKAAVVHDLRVSLRRLITLLDLLSELGYSKKLKKLRKKLKDELSSLGNLRDLQNQEQTLKSKSMSTSLMDFKNTIKDKIKIEQKKVLSKLSDLNLKKQNHAIQILTQELKVELKKSAIEPEIKKKLKRVLVRQFRQFEQIARHAQPHGTNVLHRARIKLKKFRYTWDALLAFQPRSKNTEKRLKRIQTNLGQIQDIAVLIRTLIEFLAERRERHTHLDLIGILCAYEKKYEASQLQFFATRKQMLQKIHDAII